MLIREEVPADFDATAELNRAAFGGDHEADLIARLRADRLVITSLVAQVRSEIVGHILFSMLPTEVDGRTIRAAALAPWPCSQISSTRASAPSSWRRASRRFGLGTLRQ